jgi:regulator of RNase E activity RraA
VTRLTPEQLVQLRRLTTPTVYNGWERVTRHDPARDGFNIEEATDFAPQLGPMVGYAVTAVVDVSGSSGRADAGWSEFRRYVAEQPGPKIVVVQDLDKPRVLGSIWGEVAATMFRSLGCVGTITDGGVRDINEMSAAGFKAIARRLTVGHGRAVMVRFGGEVEVFGRSVAPGQLIHADHHGFLAIPPEDEARLLDAAMFLDAAETPLIHVGRNSACVPSEQQLKLIDEAIARFGKVTKDHFSRPGEQ